jgi:hypothetical protein
MKTHILIQEVIAGLLVLSIQTSSFAEPSYREPSEQQMQDALERAALERGGRRIGRGKIVSENRIAGMMYEVMAFEKLGCEPLSGGPGYLCTYKITSRTQVYSNDGSARGDKQADAWNRLMPTGRGITNTQTRRFLKGKNGWTATMD